MIAYLKGNILERNENYLVIDVNGVGFEVIATQGAVQEFGDAEGVVKVPTYMQVREDAMSLYGFKNSIEKGMFLKLITVSGVGPKMAVTILSSISTEDLAIAIATEDIKLMSKIKGLGKKTAEKIIVELREKVGNIGTPDLFNAGAVIKAEISSEAIEDAVLALSSLGLTSGEALKMVNKLAKEGDTAETIIKKCLKDMAR